MPSISSLLRENKVRESLGPSECGCSINQGPPVGHFANTTFGASVGNNMYSGPGSCLTAGFSDRGLKEQN